MAPHIKRVLLTIALVLIAASSRARKPRNRTSCSSCATMSAAAVGFQGCKDIPTPHIDSIAKNGVRFTQGYVSGPYCSPTRAGC